MLLEGEGGDELGGWVELRNLLGELVLVGLEVLIILNYLLLDLLTRDRFEQIHVLRSLEILLGLLLV